MRVPPSQSPARSGYRQLRVPSGQLNMGLRQVMAIETSPFLTVPLSLLANDILALTFIMAANYLDYAGHW